MYDPTGNRVVEASGLTPGDHAKALAQITNPVVRLATQFEIDCELPDSPATFEDALRSWLWFTCPAGMRAAVEAEIRKTRLAQFERFFNGQVPEYLR